jgi:hypothetical protein
MGLLYGRAGRLTAENGGFRPGQVSELERQLSKGEAQRANAHAHGYSRALPLLCDGFEWYEDERGVTWYRGGDAADWTVFDGDAAPEASSGTKVKFTGLNQTLGQL